MTDPSPPPLPPLVRQAERLTSLGLAPGGDGPALAAAAAELERVTPPGALLVLHERLAPSSQLATLMRLPAPGRAGTRGEQRPGFVVADMTDVDEFLPVPEADVPDVEVYALTGVTRGDDLRNWSPAEAAPALARKQRLPLTLVEGIHWVLQTPAVLEPNYCFMTIASRKIRPGGEPDKRTPALWISSGTGRDGAARRGAPKVGWCWWGNRHTWLGVASCEARVGVP